MGDLFPLSDYMIRVLAMLGTWFAGLASAAAVITALCLARRPEMLRLRVVVERDFDVRGGSINNFVQWDVVNIGPRPLMIERVGWVHRRKLRQVTESESVSPLRLPCTLQPGEDLCWKTSWHFGKLPSRLGYPRSVKARIYTSIGDRAYPVGLKLRKHFRDERRATRKLKRGRNRKQVSSSSANEPSSSGEDQ